MSTSLKCPNPGCSYLFDPSTVPTGVMLACPRCGMRFTLGLPTALPPADLGVNRVSGAGAGTLNVPGYPSNQPSHPANPPTHPSPVNAASVSNWGASSSVQAPPPGTSQIVEQEELRTVARSSRLQTFLLVLVSAVAFTAIAIVVWYRLNHRESDSSDQATKYKELNFEFEKPPSPWARDEDIRVLLGSPFIIVYRRDNPDAIMAFGAKDYDPRSPRESELQKGITQALEKILDVSTFRPDPAEIDRTWMGQEVKGFKFHAQLKDGTAVDGEAYRFAYKGIGYWFLSWTGENNIFEEMRPDFQEARRHCRLLDLRKDWKERQSTVASFKGDRIDYTLLDAEGVWEDDKDSDPKFEGEGADKLLRIRKGLKKGKKTDEIHDSRLVVYVLNRSGEPLDVAREHVMGIRREEIKKASPKIQVDFSEITEPAEGDPIPNPSEINPAAVSRLISIVKGAGNQNRFHVVSAARIEDKIVIVHAYTSLENKETVEQLFIQIASSLHGG